MNNIVAMQPQRAEELTGKQLDLIRHTVASDTNEQEFNLFMEASRRIGLDPFRKQIYAVVYSKDNAQKRKMSIITGIDGFRAVAARNGNYRPDEEEADIVYDKEEKSDTNKLGIVKATVTAWKADDAGNWHPVKAVAYWDEYAPLKENWSYDEAQGKKVPDGTFRLDATSMWRKMPRVMITKCAEGLAIRKGWPEDLSGVYSPEEMAQAEATDQTASEAADAYQVERRLIATSTANAITFHWEAGEPLEAIPLGGIADRILAYIGEAEHSGQIEAWRDRNRTSLQEYWSRCKSDALEVRKAIDARVAALNSETQETEEDPGGFPGDA